MADTNWQDFPDSAPQATDIFLAMRGAGGVNPTGAQIAVFAAANAGDGTVGAPGHSFASDPDTGMYRPGANIIGLATNGIEAIRIDSSQRVGIGTASPSEAVETLRSGSTFVIYKATNSNGNGKVGVRDTGEAFIEASSGRDIGLWLNGSRGAVLLSSGNFGIGISSPTSKLDVRGGNGTVANFVGNGGAFQGFGVQNNNASASAYGAIFYDAKNENAIPVANYLCDINTDGSSAWIWSLTAAGLRTADRRTEKLRLTTADLRAGGDNAQTLGTSGVRWSGGYIATAWVVTSDEREKLWHGFSDELKAKVRRICRAIMEQMGFFQFLDQIEEKSEDGARWHFGVKAQYVWSLFADEGLCAPLVGTGANQRPDPAWQGPPPPALLCWDIWEDRYEPVYEEQQIDTETVVIGQEPTGVLDQHGQALMRDLTEEQPVMGMVEVGQELKQAAGNRFGLRVDQLGLLLDWSLHDRDKEKDATIADLSDRLAMLEAA